jgi:hypothetical protein
MVMVCLLSMVVGVAFTPIINDIRGITTTRQHTVFYGLFGLFLGNIISASVLYCRDTYVV